jgi:hypothetical protein
MARRSSPLRTLAFAALALLVVIGFLGRRTGVTPGTGPSAPSAPAFDPGDFRDVPVVEAVDAHSVVGERAVVCGTVVNAVFASTTRGRPTYLNLDRAYPDQPFDAVIWGRDRDRFPAPPEVAYRGRRVCVAGRVTIHQGTPRIEVGTPEQVRPTPGSSRPAAPWPPSPPSPLAGMPAAG